MAIDEDQKRSSYSYLARPHQHATNARQHAKRGAQDIGNSAATCTSSAAWRRAGTTVSRWVPCALGAAAADRGCQPPPDAAATRRGLDRQAHAHVLADDVRGQRRDSRRWKRRWPLHDGRGVRAGWRPMDRSVPPTNTLFQQLLLVSMRQFGVAEDCSSDTSVRACV